MALGCHVDPNEEPDTVTAEADQQGPGDPSWGRTAGVGAAGVG